MFGRSESPKVFADPREEIAYLRSHVRAREEQLKELGQEITHEVRDTAAVEALSNYGEQVKKSATHAREGGMYAKTVETSAFKVADVLTLAKEKGVATALATLSKINDPYLTDEVHRELVSYIHSGELPKGFTERAPLWGVLHMTLFEVALPETKGEESEKPLREMVSAMEQFYAGMRSVSVGKRPEHFTLEVAVSNNSDHIVFYVAVPTEDADLFEKHLLSLYPHALITPQEHDYNVFVEGGDSLGSVATLKKEAIYPLRTYDEFDHDPLSVLLNTFSKIERNGGGAAIQIVLRSTGDRYTERYNKVISQIRDGVPVKKAIKKSTPKGDFVESIKELFVSKKKKDEEKKDVDQNALEVFEKKIESPILETNIRIVVSTNSHARTEQVLGEIESSFNQFQNTKGNQLVFKRYKGGKLRSLLRAFSFREFSKQELMPLATQELTSLIHFPVASEAIAPQFKQLHAKNAPAPVELPQEGTLLGVNEYRGTRSEVYLTPEDRLRHLYIIGQTGTGKTSLMKNMIAEDIKAGHGVCFIDPHGTDIADVIARIPEERKKDLIYFDPARTDRVIGLNMLEFDPAHPEQKTFVVNELFSIFQKLYGKVPESMGPMFEQYFRNATLLVLEDPESGSTLLDISRVMADSKFRAEKLRKARNPVVVEFWQKIATQAGGEAALENIVPYITSKFDIFTANEYMRPIIGQQKSSFNFRELMDDRKILLVNLSKGRLGEINANLIGMIIVGKILMAALSRVDGNPKSQTPFYLHIDEFQNVTTNSIASILSEARKYKLGLTIAHQFIAQIQEEIRDAVFGNVGSIASFRVGSDDAEFLEKQFAPVFDAHDLMNVANYNAYVRILAHGIPTKPFDMKTIPPEGGDPAQVEPLIADSYNRYGVPRRKIEMEIATRYQQGS